MLSKNSKTFENKFDEFVMMMANSEKRLQEDKVREQKVLTINCKNIGMVASKRERLNCRFCIGDVKNKQL